MFGNKRIFAPSDGVAVDVVDVEALGCGIPKNWASIIPPQR